MPIAVTLLQILAQYGPQVFAAAVAIAHHPDPTKEDFLALLDSIAKEDYDSIIEARRAARGLTSGPIPVPPGPIDDPTAIEYATKEEAIAHVVPTMYPLVVKRADGKFSIWPVITIPSGAEQVYP